MNKALAVLIMVGAFGILNPRTAYAAEACSKIFSGPHYKTYSGGFVKLKDGSVVEGSKVKGGLQPHTVIDYKHPALAELLEGARAIRSLSLEPVKKIQLITEAAHRTLTHNTYTDPTYLSVMKKGMEDGGNISFGEYIKNRSGTCRENALFMHLALQEAGVENRLSYALYTHFNFDKRTSSLETVTEDHAFVVVNWNGQEYMVDSYFHEAHGLSLNYVLKNKFITKDTPRAPWAYDLWAQTPAGVSKLPVRIEAVHNFPQYWVPEQ